MILWERRHSRGSDNVNKQSSLVSCGQGRTPACEDDLSSQLPAETGPCLPALGVSAQNAFQGL